MTKKKSKSRTKPVFSKIKDPVKPRWMRVTKIITLVFLIASILAAIVLYMISYQRLISNHK